MSQQPMLMLDLEERLRDDADGEMRQRLCDDLDTERQRLSRLLDQGAPPAHAEALKTLIGAYQAAHETVQRVWARFHPTQADR
ncbi:hypothetical protein [uncultured Thiohalocapsa sp.]|uniref:hypothetical protein n=1 Tax=uncultured Thiohalocapsa sp. TaxID=768990 RepID=UPI0025DA8383|nr:hypothetical protein [uncultured Thiohalocapsa sp.]